MVSEQACYGMRQKTILEYFSRRANVVYFVFDKDGYVIETNSFTNELVGEACGKHYQDVFVDFDRSLDIETLTDHVETTHLLHVNTVKNHPESFFFDFMGSGPETIAFGRPDYDQVEVLRRNLYEVSSQLSNANRELHKTNAELTKISDLKNQFVGMAAHDLRSPIGHILACSDFLMEEAIEGLDEEKVEFLRIIRSSSEFMMNLIDEFLDISLIEAGKLSLDAMSTDLIGLVRRNIELNNFLAHKKQVHINLSCFESVPELTLDRTKIEQVLNNLLSNAIKFSNPGSTIDVTVLRGDDHVIVSVADKGVGIPQDELGKLFNIYEKSSVKSTGGEAGTGLGLAIAHKIILAHKGRLWVESQLGEGSTFSFTIPMT
jgi:signal transduction histidine kinase